MWTTLLNIIIAIAGYFLAGATMSPIAATLFFSIPTTLRLKFLGVFQDWFPLRGCLIALAIGGLAVSFLFFVAWICLSPFNLFNTFLLGSFVSLLFLNWEVLYRGNIDYKTGLVNPDAGIAFQLYRDNILSIPKEIDEALWVEKGEMHSIGWVLAMAARNTESPFLKPNQKMPWHIYSSILILDVFDRFLKNLRYACIIYFFISILLIAALGLNGGFLQGIQKLYFNNQPYQWDEITWQIITSPLLGSAVILFFLIITVLIDLPLIMKSLKYLPPYDSEEASQEEFELRLLSEQKEGKEFYTCQTAAEQKHALSQYLLDAFLTKDPSGLHEFNIQDYQEGAELFVRANEEADLQAQFSLGGRYMQGEGIAQDFEKALYWYEKAAEQGHIQAQCNLAMIYGEGQGALQNFEQAFYWCQKAAEQGFSAAQYNLAVMYAQGKGISQNLKKAAYWHEKAAKQGNISAQYNLGHMYYHGQGVHQNFKKAVYWYQKAAEQGFSAAQFNLGRMYVLGQGVKEDLEKAYIWTSLAADQGEEAAIVCRDMLINDNEMTPEQIKEAQHMVREWAAIHLKVPVN